MQNCEHQCKCQTILGLNVLTDNISTVRRDLSHLNVVLDQNRLCVMDCVLESVA